VFPFSKKNQDKKPDAEPTTSATSQTIKDLIAPAAIEVASKQIRLGDAFCRTLFVFTYPRYLTANWFAPVINLDQQMNLSLFIHPVETPWILKKLEKKVAQVQVQIEEREEKGLVRDPMLDTAWQDLEDLRDSLQQGTEKFFKFGLYITLLGKSEKMLDSMENRLRSILESKMVYLKPALFQQPEGFISTLPLAHDQIAVHTSLNSTPLSSIFPFVSVDLTDNQGILYGINQHNNSLILFDRFSLENANSVILAKSGAGKSYAVKLEVIRSLMFDTDVIIIDPEKEYHYLAETVGGSFIDISLTSPNHLNAFDLPALREDETPESALKGNILNLTGLLKIMLGALSNEEESILDKALTETYASYDITGQTDFTGKTAPTMQDLKTVLQNMVGGQSLASRLERFTGGSFASFFNQRTTISLTHNLVVFSIRDMEDQLRPMAMYIILHFIWNSIRSQLKKRILVVDEAWWIMQHPEGAAFLFGIAKRARKYFLGLTTISQDIEDFVNNPYGKPIITNSSLQLLLRQSPAAIEAVARAFNLTDQEKYLLLECGVGEGLFFAGLKHAAIKVIASYSEDQVITTDPAQLLEVEKAKQELEQ